MPTWLILVHQLPAKPSNARVKTWRRLQRLGAIAFRNSVYVLPNSTRAREDLVWLRGEILALKGEATVLEANTIDTLSSDEVVSAFRSARERDFNLLVGAIRKSIAHLKRAGATSRARGRDVERAARHYHERLVHLESVDFFGARGRQEARAALTAMERLMQPRASRAISMGPMLKAEAFRGRRWVTRPRPGIDRCASAWLIRRFIDPDAAFGFRALEDRSPRAIPFDTFGAEFSHQGDLCTFEVLAQRFGIEDRAVERIGQVVHDLDLKDERFRLPETATIGRLVDGLQATHKADDALLEQGIILFETLYASFASGPVPARRPARRAAPGNGLT